MELTKSEKYIADAWNAAKKQVIACFQPTTASFSEIITTKYLLDNLENYINKMERNLSFDLRLKIINEEAKTQRIEIIKHLRVMIANKRKEVK